MIKNQMAEPCIVCDRIWVFRPANDGALPKQLYEGWRSDNVNNLSRLRRRAHGNIDRGKSPSEMELSSTDKTYLRNTLAEPMPTVTTAGLAGAGAYAAPGASLARNIGDEVPSSDDVQYLRETLDGPHVEIRDESPQDPSLARKIAGEVLAWQASQGCQNIPKPHSHPQSRFTRRPV